ncbi:MAG: DUF1161 domain-containing protein [Pseudobdellovibrio sp.]
MMKKMIILSLVLTSTQVFAAKKCEELKSEIEEKLTKKGVQNFTLSIVANDEVKDQKVVGSCDGGTKKITYVRK